MGHMKVTMHHRFCPDMNQLAYQTIKQTDYQIWYQIQHQIKDPVWNQVGNLVKTRIDNYFGLNPFSAH